LHCRRCPCIRPALLGPSEWNCSLQLSPRGETAQGNSQTELSKESVAGRGAHGEGCMNSASPPDFTGVTRLIQRYFDGLYTSDAKLLADVFHPSALYCSAVEGELILRDMGDYLPIVAARESPHARQEQRSDHIESIDFAGASVAQARVR